MKTTTHRSRLIAALAGGAVVAGLLAAVPAAPAQAKPVVPSAPDKLASVEGQNGKVKAGKPDPSDKAALKAAPEVDWPQAGTTEVAPGEEAAGAVTVAASKGRAAAAPDQVRVEMLGRAAAKKANVDGVLFRVRRTDAEAAAPASVSVSYDDFRYAFGGDWASRLRLYAIDGDQVTELPGRNDAKAGTVTAPVKVAGASTTYALAAGPSGSTGDYKATSLSPEGKWQVSANSGTFSWSYPLRLPPVPGKLAPDLAASYSSAGADGRTVATNSQPSWLGEGWNLGVGFIERSYKSCADDLGGNNGQTKTGDMCWETENATLSLAGQSGELVYAGNHTWRPEKEDGSKVEQLFGRPNGDDNQEYWKVTTKDGTQYFFGQRPDSAWTMPVFGNDAGEPCNKATFATSYCTQAYRWNLDEVIDAHGNTITYRYATETNKYALNLGAATVDYTRGGTLARAEYGTRVGGAGSAPAQVVFDVADRCVTSSCGVHDTANWPDVPWDQSCTAAPCGTKYSPTFWSTKRLAKIRTQVWTGSAYRDVDSWTLNHSFPLPGDGTSGAALWLKDITRAGLPAVTFDGTAYPNRPNSATDGLPAMNKYRIHGINTESGGTINIKYAAPNCAPGAKPAADTNTLRCFPVRWAMPPATEPVDDWFHKYVVSEVSQVDRVGGQMPQLTSYEYIGDAAWHYADNPLVDPKRRTWSEWRGYEKVVVRKGDRAAEPDRPRSRTEYQYFRGMNGDKLAAGGTKQVSVDGVADDDMYAGFQRKETVFNGDGGEVSSSVNDPWRRGPTATAGPLQAYQVEKVRTVSRTALAAGGFRTTEVKSKYDDFGNVIEANDLGDTSTGADDRCTTTTYHANFDAWLRDKPMRTTTMGVACGATPSLPGDAISDVRMSYDGAGYGVAPTKGDVTTTEKLSDYDGSTPRYVTSARATYDGYGRVLDAFDALDRKTMTRYTDTGGLTTGAVVTNPLGHVTTTTLDPAFGVPLSAVDANNRRTDLTYDGLGRLLKVWLPGRRKNIDSPNQTYGYGVRSDGPSWVSTQSLKPNGNQVVSYALLDGFLRPTQTQAPSVKGGRILTETQYDSRGLAYLTRAPYWNNDSAPGTTLFVPSANQVPSQTHQFFDGAERPDVSVWEKYDVEQWRTTTTYGGDHVTVDPPVGGTATATYFDTRGQTTELRQFHAATTTGDYDATKYRYTKAGQLASVTDPAGNAWRYGYDLRGRKITVEDPDKGDATLGYDNADQLVSSTDARGKTVVTSYDLLGRKKEVRHDSATGPVAASWTYDTLAKGALTSSTRFAGGAAYKKEATGYDAAGRPTGEKVTIPAAEGTLAGTYATGLTYKPDGSPASTALPALGDLAAETVVQEYNDLGLPSTTSGAQKYVGQTDYTELNEPSQVELGVVGKRVWQTTYYEEGTRRLGRLLTEKESSSEMLVDRLDYSYDPAGNVTSIKDVQPGSTDQQCFRYDQLRRMTEAWTGADCSASPSVGGSPAPYWSSYRYDVTGNRTSVTEHGAGGAADKVSTYTYPAPGAARPHAVQTVSTTGQPADSYEYDAAGNTVNRPGQTLTWDAEGLLTSVGDTTYAYDADGTQLIRRDADSVTLFVGGGELKLDKATGTKKGTRHYGSAAVRTSAGLNWMVSDHHGTSLTAINAGTLSATTRRQDPFGKPRGAAVAWPGGERSFVGGTENKATGLTRLGAREYDPALGKFISVDPIIDTNDPQQFNAYSYANNAPASSSDPDGLRPMDDVADWGTGGWDDFDDIGGGSGPAPWDEWDGVDDLDPPKPTRGCKSRWQCNEERASNENRKAKISQAVKKTEATLLDLGLDRDKVYSVALQASLLVAEGKFASASYCIEGQASSLWSLGASVCIGIDGKGIALSIGGKIGIDAGASAVVSGTLKLSTGPLNGGISTDPSYEFGLEKTTREQIDNARRQLTESLEGDHLKHMKEKFKKLDFQSSVEFTNPGTPEAVGTLNLKWQYGIAASIGSGHIAGQQTWKWAW